MSRSNTSVLTRRTWPQRLLLGFNVLLGLACLVSAGVLWTVRDKVNDIPRANLGGALAATAEPGDPRNILIIGTDSDEGMDPNDPVTRDRPGGTRADVIMIMRIDPNDASARLLSIPRDTWVPVGPNWRTTKINAALEAADGPANLVRTIRRNFGISIDNYVSLNFEGFRKLVDVLGGVPVHFTVPVRDDNTGLNIEEPGCQMLDSTQALAYARSRHLQFKSPRTGKWVSDPAGDLARIERQQDFIKRSLRRASDKGLRNPATASGIVDAASKAVVLDNTLKVGTILDLVDRFKTFNPDALESFQIPTQSGGNPSISYQNVVWSEATPILQRFRGGDDAALTPADVPVDVMVAKGTAATAASRGLAERGFDTGVVERVRSAPSTPTIRYGKEGRAAAEFVSRYFDLEFTGVLDSNIVGRRVEVELPAGDPAVREQPFATPRVSGGGPSGTGRSGPDGSTTSTSTTTSPAGPTTSPAGPTTSTPAAAASQRSTTTTAAPTPPPGPGVSGATGGSGAGAPVEQDAFSEVPKDPAAAAACR